MAVNRRRFLQSAFDTVLRPKITVPILIEANRRLKRYSVTVPAGTTLSQALDTISRRYRLPYWVRTDPTWSEVGGRLTHLANYRDATEEQADQYPINTRTEDGKYWMVFAGFGNLKPQQMLNSSYLLLGRLFSITTYELNYMWFGRKRLTPKVYIKLTFPNGPF